MVWKGFGNSPVREYLKGPFRPLPGDEAWRSFITGEGNVPQTFLSKSPPGGYPRTPSAAAERFIQRHHAIATPGRHYLFPEVYYVGPEEIGRAAAAGDPSWAKFILNKSRRSAIEADESWSAFLEQQLPKRVPLLPSSPEDARALAATRFVRRRWLPLSIVGGLGAVYLYNRFSGRDDAYNTIQGFPELGLAAQQRKVLTDFGSGFVTEMAGSMKAFLQMSRKEVRSQIYTRARPLLKRLNPLEKLRLPPVAFLPEYTSKGFRGSIVFQPKPWRTSLRIMAFDERGSLGENLTRALAKKDYQRLALGHEVSESVYFNKLLKKHGLLNITPSDPGWEEALSKVEMFSDPEYLFGTHYSPGVVVDEFLLAMKQGPEAWQYAKTMRQIEAKDILERLRIERNIVSDEEVLKAKGYISRVQKIMQTMEKNWAPKFNWDPVEVERVRALYAPPPPPPPPSPMKGAIKWGQSKFEALVDWFGEKLRKPRRAGYMFGPTENRGFPPKNRFSGKDDAYNTIEGLQHGGMAEVKRRELTDFGSGLIREMFGSTRAFLQVSRESLRETFYAWLKKKNIHFVKRKSWTSGIRRLRGSGEEQFFIGIPENIPSVDEMGPFDVAAMFHEGSELAYRFTRLGGSLKQSKFATPFRSQVSTHQSPAVIAEEVLLGMKLGPESYSALKASRFEELSWMRKRIGEIDKLIAKGTASSSERIERISQLEYINRVEKIYERTEKVWGPKLLPERFSGMQHGGIGGGKRDAGSDFSSPWKGLLGGISRRITKFMGRKAIPGAAKLLDPRKAAKMAQGKNLDEFARALTGETRILGKKQYGTSETEIAERIFEEVAIKKGSGAGFVTTETGGFVFLHPSSAKARAYEKATQMSIDPTLAKKVIESENFMKTLLYHEHLERQATARFGDIMKMREMKHASGQVILGEAGFIKSLGDKNLEQFFGAFRKTRTEKAIFETGLEAFGETGVAPELRQLITDFGSGYRGLMAASSRGIAKSMSVQGRAAAKLTKSSQDLRLAQEAIWNHGRDGGRKHMKYTKGHVKQLSEYGGGL